MLQLHFVFSNSSEHPSLCIRFWNVTKCTVILITPFYQVNALLTILIFVMDLCKMKSNVKRFRKYYNGRFLWFLPNREDLDFKDSILCLELTSTLFGSCLSVCLNSVLLFCTPKGEFNWSQYVSICFSLLMITKAFAGALYFDSDHERLER